MVENPMSPEQVQIFGEITALNYAVEYLYSNLLVAQGITVEDARKMRDEMIRRFEDRPFRDSPTPGEDLFAMQQHSIERLERLWRAVETRLKQRDSGE